MADDLEPIVPRDPTRLDLSDPAEVRYWSDRFGVLPRMLLIAVERVGPKSKDIELYFHDYWW
jgi:hypothetical protein